ncbi:PI2R protein, partial [Atractosteus spatula]|nr:PI2R protein [Atractosteus spatula]
MGAMLPNETCENTTRIHADGNPAVSTIMFLAGVGGNVMALAILGVHRKEQRSKSSVFCILVTGLAATDLLGTCVLSPIVFVSYARNASLLGLVGGPWLCDLFAFAMTFFGLASMLILFAMAVERCLAISHPYFYSKHVGRGIAKALLPAVYAGACLFCSLPFLGYGKHKQYCPGTWCFIEMEAGEGEGGAVLAFSLSYAALMAFLVLAVFLCNGSVIVSLCRMYRAQRFRRGSVVSSGRKRKSWLGHGEEEVEHLVLLACMTLIFVICSLPLTSQALARLASGTLPAGRLFHSAAQVLTLPRKQSWVSKGRNKFITFLQSERGVCEAPACPLPGGYIATSYPSLVLFLSICGFVSAISPGGNDDDNLLAFRFSATNPIVDPWIFIIFRKSTFHKLRSLLCCRFSQSALKTSSFPEPSQGHGTPFEQQTYCSLPVTPH